MGFALFCVTVHPCTAILAVFFSRLIPIALSGDDKATRRAAPLVSAKMCPSPMHHRNNVGSGRSAHNAPNEFFGSCDCNGGFFILWRIRLH